MSVSPASFPATGSGYRAYVKALGFDLNDYRYQTYYMEKGKFMAIDRTPIMDRVDSALDRVFTRMCAATDSTNLDLAYSSLCHLSNCFNAEMLAAGLFNYSIRKAKEYAARITGYLQLEVLELIDATEKYNLHP